MKKKDADKNRQTQSSFVAAATAAAAAVGFLCFSECFLYFLLSAVCERVPCKRNKMTK